MSDTLSPDTGIFTLWFSCNYGAILTTYALYRLLEQEGCRPLILDQAPVYGYMKWCEEGTLSRAFMARHGLCCSTPLRTDAEIQKLNDELQTFVVGSDQVWRWDFTKKYGLLHFLDFVRGDKRKIAVSSSFGTDVDNRPADSMRKVGYYLRSFDAVSVREKSGVELLRRHYGVKGEWIPDPVFLCGTECYAELMKDTKIPQKPYLLSYVLEPDDKMRLLIKTIAAERGLAVINMVDAMGDFDELCTRFGDIGDIEQDVMPEQWIAYILNCSYMVTDSFHGVCFAHLYHRPFLCVAPPARGLARFTSLLGLTGLERCLIPPDYTEADWQAATAPIDWDSVQERLNTAIGNAKVWLHAALTAPRKECIKAKAELVYELLYADNGIAERNRELESQVQRKLTTYRTDTLPKIILLKKIILRIFSYCPILRQYCLPHLRNQQRLAAYLEQRGS